MKSHQPEIPDSQSREPRERFVSAQEAAKVLDVKPKLLQEMARRGIIKAYPLGTGAVRRIWRFKLSEIAAIDPQRRYDPQ